MFVQGVAMKIFPRKAPPMRKKASNQKSTRQCLNNFQPPHASASEAKIQSSLTRGKVSQSNRHYTLFREWTDGSNFAAGKFKFNWRRSSDVLRSRPNDPQQNDFPNRTKLENRLIETSFMRIWKSVHEIELLIYLVSIGRSKII